MSLDSTHFGRCGTPGHTCLACAGTPAAEAAKRELAQRCGYVPKMQAAGQRYEPLISPTEAQLDVGFSLCAAAGRPVETTTRIATKHLLSTKMAWTKHELYDVFRLYGIDTNTMMAALDGTAGSLRAKAEQARQPTITFQNGLPQNWQNDLLVRSLLPKNLRYQ
jgi:hypothetical protein